MLNLFIPRSTTQGDLSLYTKYNDDSLFYCLAWSPVQDHTGSNFSICMFFVDSQKKIQILCIYFSDIRDCCPYWALRSIYGLWKKRYSSDPCCSNIIHSPLGSARASLDNWSPQLLCSLYMWRQEMWLNAALKVCISYIILLRVYMWQVVIRLNQFTTVFESPYILRFWHRCSREKCNKLRRAIISAKLFEPTPSPICTLNLWFSFLWSTNPPHNQFGLLHRRRRPRG